MASPTRSVQTFSDGSISSKCTGIYDSNLRVPLDSNMYGVVLHDFQLAEFDYKPRQLSPGYEQKRPVPATRMMWGKHGGRIYDFVEFSSLWQRWLLELLQGAIGGAIPYGKIEYFYDKVNGKEVRVKEHPYAYAHFTPASLLYAYGNLIENHRSFTDQHAPENGYRDFIASRNVSKKPYQWKCLTTTGNIVKILGSTASHYIVEAFDLLKPPPPLEEVKGQFWRVHWATEQTVTELPKAGAERKWVVSRYPQVKVVCRENGLPENGTPFPLCSMGGTNLIKKSHIRLVSRGDTYSPYVPER